MDLTQCAVAQQQLEGFAVCVPLPVAWGEMDSFGHVNNIIYFRYFETARIAYFDRVGFQDSYREMGVGPILAATECRFIAPLTYPDEVLVGARAHSLSEDRFTMDYAIFSTSQKREAATGSGRIVSYDYKKLAKTPLPAAVRIAIERLEGLSR